MAKMNHTSKMSILAFVYLLVHMGSQPPYDNILHT